MRLVALEVRISCAGPNQDHEVTGHRPDSNNAQITQIPEALKTRQSLKLWLPCRGTVVRLSS
jgi:hypothetical protein